MALTAGAVPNENLPVATEDADLVSRVLDLGQAGLVGAKHGHSGGFGYERAVRVPSDRIPLSGERPPGPFLRPVAWLEWGVLHLIGEVASADEKDVRSRTAVASSGLPLGSEPFSRSDAFHTVAVRLVLVALQCLVGMVGALPRLMRDHPPTSGVGLHPVGDAVLVPTPCALHKLAANRVAVLVDKRYPLTVTKLAGVDLASSAGEVDQVVVHVRSAPLLPGVPGLIAGVEAVWPMVRHGTDNRTRCAD
jgi:hypothetical protein